MNGKAFEVARVDVTETSRVACFVALNGHKIRLPVTRKIVEITLRPVRVTP